MAAMQKGGVQSVKAKSQEELYSCYQEPEPDYGNDDDDDNGHNSDKDFPPPHLTAEELSEAVGLAYDASVKNGVSLTSDGSKSKDPPQVRPKPLHNPCVESKERQALHRELLLNYKIGKDVLQKPELDKVLRERKESARKKEWDEQMKASKGRTSLEVKLEERANKMKQEEEKTMKVIQEESQAPELTRIHRKITCKSSNSFEKS